MPPVPRTHTKGFWSVIAAAALAPLGSRHVSVQEIKIPFDPRGLHAGPVKHGQAQMDADFSQLLLDDGGVYFPRISGIVKHGGIQTLGKARFSDTFFRIIVIDGNVRFMSKITGVEEVGRIRARPAKPASIRASLLVA